MAEMNLPEVGKWYQNEDKDRFEVVAVDEAEGTIEIQYFNGDVEELDTDTWNELQVVPIAVPDDWTGPFDDLERDDIGDTERPYRPEEWGTLDNIESDIEIDWEE